MHRLTGFKAEDSIKAILEHIGENPERDGLKDTPKRVVKSFSELYSGYTQDPKEILKTEFAIDNYNWEMIALNDIEFFSMCEHHMLPFFGKAHVAYIPGDQAKVVGLSKLARVVECFSRRLQIQERLTTQISHALMESLKAKFVGVVIDAKHFCMVARGVRKPSAVMRTASYLGEWQDIDAVKREFLGTIK